ncbi:hypothetical protein DCC62_09375 [candidate division KSB1 bacterium]|nr:MAG: hypothetical protein DCC62_09375 [candidate division KSB1 bacterium]
MEALENKWRSLFEKATVESHAGLVVAEEGYYLLAAPSSSEMPAWLKERAKTELHFLQSRLPDQESCVSLMLNKQKDFGLALQHDYHAWAKDYAAKIDANELCAETVVNLAVFVRRFNELAGRQGLAIWRDQEDEKFVEVICDAFRQPVNLYAEVAQMVLSASSMADEIESLLHDMKENCRMLHNYFQTFTHIFSGYRVFVGDHYFVVSAGEQTLAPAFNYWSLLDQAINQDQVFWQGVTAIKDLLSFVAGANQSPQ